MTTDLAGKDIALHNSAKVFPARSGRAEPKRELQRHLLSGARRSDAEPVWRATRERPLRSSANRSSANRSSHDPGRQGVNASITVRQIAPDEVAVVHVMNRVVGRCYLLGDEPVSGKNYDHRKVMIENQLQRLAGAFGIDLLGFAIMSNHFHLILNLF